MKVLRMRIRFEDPNIAPDQAHAIALRVSELLTSARAADRLESADGLARPVADRVSEALHAAGD